MPYFTATPAGTFTRRCRFPEAATFPAIRRKAHGGVKVWRGDGVQWGMKTTTTKFTAAFYSAIAAAQTTGGHDILRMQLTMAALPAGVRFRILCAIEASERNFRKAA